MENRLSISIVFLLFTIMVPGLAIAQNDLWVRGDIKLIDNQSYKVDLRFVSQETGGLLQVKEGQQEVTLSPAKVSSFHYYDNLSAKNRSFVSIPSFNDNLTFKKKIFLEVLYQGEQIWLLKRMELKGTIITESLYLFENQHKQLYSYALSRWTKKNKPIFVNPDTRLLFGLTSDHKSELRQYARKEKISFREYEGLIKFLKYYDKISSNNQHK